MYIPLWGQQWTLKAYRNSRMKVTVLCISSRTGEECQLYDSALSHQEKSLIPWGSLDVLKNSVIVYKQVKNSDYSYCKWSVVDICFTPAVRVTSRNAYKMRSWCAADKIDNYEQFSGWKYLTLGIVALTVRRVSSNGTHTIVQLPRVEQWSSALS